MANEIIAVQHDMFKEETIKRINHEYWAPYFSALHCMDEYDAECELYMKSNASGDHIFLKLNYYRLNIVRDEQKAIEKACILRINNTNIPLSKPRLVIEDSTYYGKYVTFCYEISKDILKQIAEADQISVKIPLMKTLDEVHREIYEGSLSSFSTQESKDDKWHKVQEGYKNECAGLQGMCRVFYAAVVDESAFPSLVEKENQRFKEYKEEQAREEHEWAEQQKKKEENEKRKREIGDNMLGMAGGGYPLSLIVGGIWGFMISSWAPLIWLLVLVTVILIIMAIIRKN